MTARAPTISRTMNKTDFIRQCLKVGELSRAEIEQRVRIIYGPHDERAMAALYSRAKLTLDRLENKRKPGPSWPGKAKRCTHCEGTGVEP